MVINLTNKQVDIIIYELKQSLRGDDDAYDKKIKTIIKKLEEN